MNAAHDLFDTIADTLCGPSAPMASPYLLPADTGRHVVLKTLGGAREIVHPSAGHPSPRLFVLRDGVAVELLTVGTDGCQCSVTAVPTPNGWRFDRTESCRCRHVPDYATSNIEGFVRYVVRELGRWR